MNELVLPPSPNWYLSSILSCASDGTIAWGSKNSIVIAKTKDDSKKLDYSIIERAHSDRVTTIAFSSKNEDNNYKLVSGGDDNVVKIWNLQNFSLELKNSKLDNSHKVIGVDWSKHNSNIIYFISEDGLLVKWNISYDGSQLITLGKLTATSLACCPHDSNIVSIGSKSGLVYIVDSRGSGNINYKLRGHDAEIVSLSWCPIPINVLQDDDRKDLLLASGAKDRFIYLWRAGSDGRYQSQITFPTTPLDSNCHKSKVSAAAGNYTTVCWLEPMSLFTSSPWGELLLWKLTKNKKEKCSPQLIHAKHGKGLFSIAGLSETLFEQFENQENVNWRTKNQIKAVWTLAQDRLITCCSLLNNEISMEYTIPTQGGFVYCISACPVDTSQIAFGVGDAMIRLWNLSEPHERIIDIQTLWEKIKGKVRALSWHPEKENLLAFATNEGRVGLFDTNTRKPPILYRQYHRHIVYTIGWGPAPNVKEYALYTCGDGELVYYDPTKMNDDPICITKKKECTEFCWKPDFSIVAVGFADGSISFFKNDLSEYGRTIHTLNKAVQCLVWHPGSTSSDFNISSMENYLAVSINDKAITVFEICNVNNSQNYQLDESSFYRTVATLNDHTEKVVCLAWSPHMSGYLLSGSYDNTARVWKIETHETIAVFSSHLGPLQCCMWSPFSQDLVITGSSDFTLRIWRISDQNVSAILPMKNSRGKRTKKKKTKDPVIDSNTSNETKTEFNLKNEELTLFMEDKKEISIEYQNTEEIENTNKTAVKLIRKKRSKKASYFPGLAEVVNNNKLWYFSVKQLLNTLPNNTQNNEQNGLNSNEIKNGLMKDMNLNSDKYYPTLLGNKKDLEDAVTYEKKILNSKGHYNIVTELDLWTGNLKENLEESVKLKRLNDYLVSLAPSISKDTWEKMCEAYATQLIYEENPHKAVSYLLCINKIHEAVDVLLTSKLYKEAYVLACSKFDSKDPIIENVLREWANNAQKDGHFQNAAECYIKLGEYVKAAKLLERRKDIDSLILALELAEILKDSDLSTSIADKAILEALFISDFKSANFIIEKYPQMQYREIEVEIFIELSNIFQSINDEAIINWLKGSSAVALLEKLSKHFTPCSKKYLLLIQKDIILLPASTKMIQMNVSHQLALALLSAEQKQKLQHIVKAFEIVLQYGKSELEVEEDEFSLLIKYFFAIDNKNSENPNSIFSTNQNEITKSIRAYFSDTIINWFLKSSLNKDQFTICLDLISNILEKCIEDLLNKQSIKFWTTKNEINKLEIQLSSIMGNVQSNDVDCEVKTKAIIERLNELKNDKKQFVELRVSSPNPLFSYGTVMEFISKILNEEIREKITAIVMETWKKVLS